MTEEEIEAVERMVNEQVMADTDVQIHFSSYDEAIRDGVMALFGEKYEDRVRRVRVPGFSEELCGGTHVARTGQIGPFVILSETGIAGGVRRIEVLTGLGAVAARLQEKRVLQALRNQLQGGVEDLPARLEHIIREAQRLRKELAQLRARGPHDELTALWDRIRSLPAGKLLIGELEVETTDGIREVGDRIRERLGKGAALIAVRGGGKRILLAVVTDDLVKAGRVRADEIVREAASLAGGSGGGRPHLAMAGIPETAEIPEILGTMRLRLESVLAG